VARELPTTIEYVQDFFDEIDARFIAAGLGARVDRHEGSRWDVLGGAIGSGLVRCQKVINDAFDAHTLEGSNGTDLDIYVTRRGPLFRQPASFARGYVRLTRLSTAGGGDTIPGPNSVTDALGQEIRVPFNGKSVLFQCAQDTLFPPSSLAIDLPIIAETAGTAANVGTVDSGAAFTSQPAPIFDPTITVGQVSVSGGLDVESDDRLKQRQRLWEQVRLGSGKARVFLAALSVPGVVHVVLADGDDSHVGGFAVCYAGDTDWASTPTLLGDVALAIESARAMGPSIQVFGLTNSLVLVKATIQMVRSLTNYNLASLRAVATQKALDYFNQRADPFTLTSRSLSGRIERANDDISKVILANPTDTDDVPSPLSPSAIALNGIPNPLTRFSTNSSLINLSFAGPA
jgi:hypothetical protein